MCMDTALRLSVLPPAAGEEAASKNSEEKVHKLNETPIYNYYNERQLFAAYTNLLTLQDKFGFTKHTTLTGGKLRTPSFD